MQLTARLGYAMTVCKLIDIVTNLEAYDPESTIYAVEPWTCDSLTVVALEPDEGGLPTEAKAVGADYFLEVFIALEVLEGWQKEHEGRHVSDQDMCKRVIYYAVNDA